MKEIRGEERLTRELKEENKRIILSLRIIHLR
jgi:hypothetical protein